MSLKPGKSPSELGLYFYATMMALFGATLGFAYMLSFPAQAFSSQEAYATMLAARAEPIPESKPGDAYYIEGSVLKTRTWELKRAQLTTKGAQTVKFAEGEMNAWLSAKFRPSTTPVGEEKPSILIVPGAPNIAITPSGSLYLNLPTKISCYGSASEFTVSARCSIEPSGLKFEKTQVNNARVPFPNILGSKIFETLLQGYQSTEEYSILSDALARADSIELAGGELVLKFP